MTDIPGRIDAAMQERAQRENQNQFMAFVKNIVFNIEFPANVINKKCSIDGKGRKPVRTDVDLINARLLENGILFDDIQSLPEIQLGVAQAVENLMRTQAFNSVQIELDTNDNYNNRANKSPPLSSSSSSASLSTPHTENHPHRLNVILDEKNWYSLYIGGGVKHEGIEEAMNSATMLPKAQFETSFTLSNLTGFLDRSFLQYTVDQTANSRFFLTHERPLYSWFTENSIGAYNILALAKGSQYSLGFKALIDTVDFESSRSYQEYQRMIGWHLDNTGNVAKSEMACTTPGSIYWGIDHTLSLRDIVPRKHPELPYGADASPEIVMQSGSNILHSLKCEARTNGGWLDDKYQPTVGLDGFCLAELAGPPGDVGFAKVNGGLSIHIPMCFNVADVNRNDSISGSSSFLDKVSLHASCAGGVIQPILYDGLCRGPTISDRFFVGGPMQLRGFLPAGIGPRTKGGGSTTPGGDAMGGSLYYTTSVAASVLPPGGLSAQYGIRLFTFANAGTLVGVSPLTNNHNRFQQENPITWMQVAQSTRAAAGIGVSGGTCNCIPYVFPSIYRLKLFSLLFFFLRYPYGEVRGYLRLAIEIRTKRRAS